MPAAIAGGLVATGMFTAGSIATALTASVITGALVGAAIGGITAAVTGGDIGKGLLFGAVGGAVTGALSFGLSGVMQGFDVAAQQISPLSSGVSGGYDQVGVIKPFTEAPATGIAKEAVNSGGKSFFSKMFDTDAKVAMAGEALGAAVGGVADVYSTRKQSEAAADMQREQIAAQERMQERSIASAEKIANLKASAGGGGGGASGPDYTIDELIRRDREAAAAERETVLAKVGAELSGQKELREQEYAEAGAARERASAAAGALKSGTGGRVSSRSTETIADIQERIREGESASGDPNTGVVPPVTYVPPNKQAIV